MNIGLVSDTYLPTKNGVVTVMRQLKEGLAQRGHNVNIIAPQVPDYPHTDPDVIRIPSLPFQPALDIRMAVTSPYHLRRLFEGHPFDIIHTHTEFNMGYSAKRAAKSLNLPLVHTTHTFYDHFRHYVPLGQHVPLSVVHRTHAAYLKGYNAIICPSQKAVDYFAPLAQNLHHIPNAIDFDHRPEPRPKAGRNLLYVGRLSVEKRSLALLHTLLPLLREGYHLTLVGDGAGRAELERFAQQEKITEAVTFMGWVEWERTPDFYATADAFVTASLSENHPMTVLEALYCGLPIVAYDDPSLREMVTDGENGYLAHDADDFRHKLKLLLKNPQQYATKIRANAHIFTLENHLNATENLYQIVRETYENRNTQRPQPTNRIMGTWRNLAWRKRNSYRS